MTKSNDLNAPALVQKHVTRYLRQLLPRGPHRSRRIGLAISGGVDSMALASLCRGSKTDWNFTGFVVDHGARHDSSDEAAQVADLLHNMGIRPQILRLDWRNLGDPGELTNFEAAARRLRYRALGTACYRAGIESLLVGHHADDQAETVLGRIVSGYLGTGLAGMQDEAGIPDCAGVYGVDRSGSGAPRDQDSRHSPAQMAMESGGVKICRPLLPFTKDQLVMVCREEKVKWFEDPTNADQKLTVRNTIRHLHGEAALPVALRRNRLCAVARTCNARNASVDAEAERLFKALDVELNPRLGKVTFTIDHDTIEDTCEALTYRTKSSLLRRLMHLITSRNIPLQDLGAAVDMVFARSVPARAVQVGKVNIQPAKLHNQSNRPRNSFVLTRQKPTRKDTQLASPLELHTTQDDTGTDPTSSGWILWDHRYWIRARYDGREKPADPAPLSVRFLTPTSLGDLRKTLDAQQRAVLDRRLAPAKAHGVVWTLPAVVARVEGQDHVVSLPSLSWDSPGRGGLWPDGNLAKFLLLLLHVEIRYMSVCELW